VQFAQSLLHLAPHSHSQNTANPGKINRFFQEKEKRRAIPEEAGSSKANITLSPKPKETA
jgi:hypothetical protein